MLYFVRSINDLNFLFRLFEEHGELLALFEKFKELKTKEDQANSLELAEHASTVMNTLDEGIKGLDNLDAFFEFLHQVGASHRKIPGFKVEYFWVSIYILYCFFLPVCICRLEIYSFFILMISHSLNSYMLSRLKLSYNCHLGTPICFPRRKLHLKRF